MQGVQPIAKIAPSPNDASQPPLAADEPAAEPLAEPAAARRRPAPAPSCRSPSRSSPAPRHRAAATAVEAGDLEDAREVQPEHDQDHAADLAQEGHVVDEAGRRRYVAVTPRSVNTTPKPSDVGDAHAGARASATAGRLPGAAGDGDRRQLAEVGRHERQDARREEAEQPGGERDEEREVAASCAGGRPAPSARNRRSFAGDVASSSRRAAELHDGDPVEEPRSPSGSAVDVALAEAGERPAARGAVLEQALDEARVSSHRSQPARVYRTGRGGEWRTSRSAF